MRGRSWQSYSATFLGALAVGQVLQQNAQHNVLQVGRQTVEEQHLATADDSVQTLWFAPQLFHHHQAVGKYTHTKLEVV